MLDSTVQYYTVGAQWSPVIWAVYWERKEVLGMQGETESQLGVQSP